jgi:hypothetical protein
LGDNGLPRYRRHLTFRSRSTCSRTLWLLDDFQLILKPSTFSGDSINYLGLSISHGLCADKTSGRCRSHFKLSSRFN